MAEIGIATDGRIGPGIVVTVTTDFIGPLPSGSFVEVIVYGGGGEDILLRSTQAVLAPTASITLGSFFGDSGAQLPTIAVADGATVRTVITWYDAPGHVIDTDTRTDLHWDPSTGLFAVLGRQIALLQSPTVLTPSLDAILAAVRMELTEQA